MLPRGSPIAQPTWEAIADNRGRALVQSPGGIVNQTLSYASEGLFLVPAARIIAATSEPAQPSCAGHWIATPSTINMRPFTAACRIGRIAA
jgi:hypothetical protein